MLTEDKVLTRALDANLTLKQSNKLNSEILLNQGLAFGPSP